MSGQVWTAVVTEEPEPNLEYPTDPQDWSVELRLEDDSGIHEIIYVVFTGTTDDDGVVTMTPEEVVDARLDAMLKGLNG